MNNTLGESLKEMRLLRGWSCKKLADVSNTDEESIRVLENPNYNMNIFVTLRYLLKLAKVLHCNLYFGRKKEEKSYGKDTSKCYPKELFNPSLKLYEVCTTLHIEELNQFNGLSRQEFYKLKPIYKNVRLKKIEKLLNEVDILLDD